MSIALRIYHANPIVRSASGVTPPWELSLTMEHRSYDELSRLWQATTAPLRMSVVFRAAVAFIEPDAMPPPAPHPTALSLALSAPSLLAPPPGTPDGYPIVLGTTREDSYVAPDGSTVTFTRSPASVASGHVVTVAGTNFGTTGVSDHVYLLPPSGAEVDVTAWEVSSDSAPARFVLSLPTAAGNPPTGSPDPGVHQLRVGSGALGSPGATRSDATPLSVAAFVDTTGGPVLSGAATYTVNGRGFLVGETEVLVGTTALTETAGTPSAGQVSVAATETSFEFAPPAGVAGTVAAGARPRARDRVRSGPVGEAVIAKTGSADRHPGPAPPPGARRACVARRGPAARRPARPLAAPPVARAPLRGRAGPRDHPQRGRPRAAGARRGPRERAPVPGRGRARGRSDRAAGGVGPAPTGRPPRAPGRPPRPVALRLGAARPHAVGGGRSAAATGVRLSGRPGRSRAIRRRRSPLRCSSLRARRGRDRTPRSCAGAWPSPCTTDRMPSPLRPAGGSTRSCCARSTEGRARAGDARPRPRPRPRRPGHWPTGRRGRSVASWRLSASRCCTAARWTRS